MNISKIKEVVNSDKPDHLKEQEIIVVIAEDDTVIPTLLKILNAERSNNYALLTNMNTLLSKAEIGLSQPQLNTEGFMQKEIIQFFKDNYGKAMKRIGHCFKTFE